MPLTSTWLTQDGSCALDDIVNQPATLASAPHEDCSSLETRIKLLKPSDGSNSCIIALTPPLQSCWTALVLTSTARTIEVSAQSAGGAMSYISTVRAQPLVGSAWYRATVALKGSADWEVLQLKLLSLQGDRSSCSIAALQMMGNSDVEGVNGLPQHFTEDIPIREQRTMPHEQAARAQQQQQPLSQMDELHLLVSNIQQQGCAGAAPAVPESLEFLYSKAVQQPGSAAGAMKSLTAAVAQGMLLRHAAGKQHAAVQQAERQRHQQLGGGQQNSESSFNSGINRLTSAAVKAADADVCGDVGNMQAVLQAMRRVEHKVDQLLGSVQQLAVCLQQMDGRIATLEGQSDCPQ